MGGGGSSFGTSSITPSVLRLAAYTCWVVASVTQSAWNRAALSSSSLYRPRMEAAPSGEMTP